MKKELAVNPLRLFGPKDYLILLLSVSGALGVQFLGGFEPLALTASALGLCALLLLAKGSPWGAILMICFSLLYGLISYNFRYYGEILTYVGISAPLSFWILVNWLKNPSRKPGQVRVGKPLGKLSWLFYLLVSLLLSAALFPLLWLLETPNLVWSGISLFTSFLATFLAIKRNPAFPLAYAANDVVLVVLWSLAALKDSHYLAVVLLFLIFLINDLYGFYCWKIMEREARRLEGGL